VFSFWKYRHTVNALTGATEYQNMNRPATEVLSHKEVISYKEIPRILYSVEMFPPILKQL
jgi:hypothetical protein